MFAFWYNTLHKTVVSCFKTATHVAMSYGVYRAVIKELSTRVLWDADGNRNWAIFAFNLPSHNHIHIAKYLFAIRDE